MGTTVDWNRWLPPRKLRDRGDLEFKVGQVWAWRYDDDPIVFRMLQYGRGKDASVRVDGLAREKFDGESPIAMRAAGCYLLVQDVGQPEPTPPDALWQEAYALPPDICYADACTGVRVMGRDEHGKAYCWKHRALWGTVTREVANEQTMANMGRALAASMDKSMMDAFQAAGLFLNEGPGVDRRTRLKVGDVAMVGSDGEIVRTPCTGKPGCRCGRQPVGKIIARRGENVIVAIGAGDFEFRAAADLSLQDLPDYTPAAAPVAPALIVETEGAFAPGTFSNLLSPAKPLTVKSVLDAMAEMDRIKPRDAETKKRYDDLVMSGLKTHMDKPIMPDPYYWRPFLDAPAAKPKLTEAEITRLQWAADDGGRYEPELFPDMPEFSVPRTQSQSIAAGLGVWSTRGDAKLPPEPKPYPHVSDEDLLPDAGR